MSKDIDLFDLGITVVICLIIAAVILLGGAILLRESWFVLTTGNLK